MPKRRSSKNKALKKIISLILTCAICLSLMLFNLGFGGKAGNVISTVLFGIFGVFQYPMPIVLLAFVFYFSAVHKKKRLVRKGIFAVLLLYSVMIIVHLITFAPKLPAPNELYSVSVFTQSGSGIAGGFIAWLLAKCFGLAVAAIIFVAAALCALVFVFDTAFISLNKIVKKHAVKLAEKISAGIKKKREEKKQQKIRAEKTKKTAKVQKAKKIIPLPSEPEKLMIEQKAAQKPEAEQQEKPALIKEYVFPSTDLLQGPDRPAEKEFPEPVLIKAQDVPDSPEAKFAAKLTDALQNFGIQAQITEVLVGPTLVRLEFTVPKGVKVSKVVALKDDLKLALAAADLHMEAPVPGKSAIGIEIPSKTKEPVLLKELISHPDFSGHKSPLAFCAGKSISGEAVIADLEKMPHLLIAGATGSGKSVCINTIIMSLLYHAAPQDVRLILIDPKIVELSVYNGIPHLLVPVVTQADKAREVLEQTVQEMMNRYQLLAAAGKRNIQTYNKSLSAEENHKKLPRIVVIIDELADLMMADGKSVEESICRITQLARACGIHLVLATQRPTTNVVTGLIKANVPSRISFAVASAIDSRVILDESGAEDLLGNGDMLFAPQGEKPRRLQGPFVSEEEIHRVVSALKNQ
ncbi:MAG: DNA translocase FtsK 4TM domain-containing protein [Treponemataceae bacterium]|nr:DNA translocase FtsK 4TM domain-containing protein [Treponemataceae bacterium]